MEYEVFCSQIEEYERKKLKPTHALHIACVDICFQLYITKAMQILIEHVGGRIRPSEKRAFDRDAHYMSKIIKPNHRDIYEDLFTRKPKLLHDTYKKLINSTTQLISTNMIDVDFMYIYIILQTLCERKWHVPILSEYTSGFDPTDFIFEVDVVFQNIKTYYKK